MKSLEGYRTIISSAVVTISGILVMMGYEVPTEFSDQVTGAIMAVLGVWFGLMRIFTSTPVGQKKDQK